MSAQQIAAPAVAGPSLVPLVRAAVRGRSKLTIDPRAWHRVDMLTVADAETIAHRMRAARESLGWSATDAARALGVSRQGLQEWEAGRTPRPALWDRIASAYRTTVEQLFLERARPRVAG